MRFVTGMALGLVLGLSASAFATVGFYTGKEAFLLDQHARAGYVSGVFDTVSYMYSEVPTRRLSDYHYWNGLVGCLRGHGDTNGDLARWATSEWNGDDHSAAGIIVAACDTSSRLPATRDSKAMGYTPAELLP